MSAVIRNFHYSKGTGRGRGILGLKELDPCKKIGGRVQMSAAEEHKEQHPLKPPSKEVSEPPKTSGKVVIALFDYNADKDSPGGFRELSVQKGQMLELLRTHPDNEHWWEVRNEDEDIGYTPASYLIIKDEQVLPWLQPQALKSEEEERRERVKRLAQQKSAHEGTGFGPAPKDAISTLPAKKYVSAYSRDSSSSFYCEVCDKKLNGPKPYQAHMSSKAHKEELELLET